MKKIILILLTIGASTQLFATPSPTGNPPTKSGGGYTPRFLDRNQGNVKKTTQKTAQDATNTPFVYFVAIAPAVNLSKTSITE